MLKVAQCWDDGVINDARLTDILRKHQAKATFNLNPELNDAKNRKITGKFQDFEVGKLARNEFLSVYQGFQVASHTMHHYNADAVPLEQFMRDAVDARKFLEDMFQRECLGFAWPCGKVTDETADAMRDAGFAYGRTTENREDVTRYDHPMKLHSSCHFLNPDFKKHLEKARESGIFYFWGHSYEMKDDPRIWEQFERTIAELSADPEIEWIDVIDIVKS